jgi:aspartyl-tRNA(Asn)/glutamyl-tRNA(Gln) amidotransferase subunit B
VLIIEGARADFFETAAKGRDAKLTANWVANELLGHLAKDGLEITESPLSPADIAGLVELIETDVISSKIAREVFEHMWAGEGSAAAIVEARGLTQVSDTGALETMIDALIAANPGQAESVKTKPQAIGWFVGQVMRQTQGKANPATVNALLKAKLGL